MRNTTKKENEILERLVRQAKKANSLDWLNENGDKVWYENGQWLTEGASFDNIDEAIEFAANQV